MSAKQFNGAGQNGIRRVLRRRETREYFKDGGWTQDPAEAETFSDVLEAAETCTRYGLDNVELALRYEASAADFFCTPIR